jgi:hypothetical protein
MSSSVLIILVVFAIPIFFIFRWAFNEYEIRSQKNRKLITVISTIIASPVVYVGLLLIVVHSLSKYAKSDFDHDEWRTNVEERYKFSDDIIKSEMLIGKTKTEVIQILGDDYFASNAGGIYYILGFLPGLFKIDPDILDIKFENGIVVNINQYQS